MRTTLLLAAVVAVSWVVMAGRSLPDEKKSRLASEQASSFAEMTRSATILSPVYSIDKKYRSMMGPYSEREVQLQEGSSPELVWITGYSATMVADDGREARPQELMCHSNLDIDVAAHEKIVGRVPGFSPRLFTLSQGQLEVELPIGYGIPVSSAEALSLTTQVLNLNFTGDPPISARHKVEIEFIRDADLADLAGGSGTMSMKALFPIAAYGLAALDGATPYFGVEEPDAGQHGPGCLPGDNAAEHTYVDPFGREFSGHWVVPPGRQVNRTLVTHLMRIPYDTTIHYIAVHLHPFAESLELRDLTADRTVFESRARNFEDRIGLENVESFSSSDGIEVYREHEYEMVSTYHNTSSTDQDSMAVMYIYMRDHEFDRKKALQAIAEN